MIQDEFDVKINATKGEVQTFLSSILWNDIEKELAIWRDGLAKEYDEVKDLLELGRIQGRREAIAYLLQLPIHFLKLLEEREHDTERSTSERYHKSVESTGGVYPGDETGM